MKLAWQNSDFPSCHSLDSKLPLYVLLLVKSRVGTNNYWLLLFQSITRTSCAKSAGSTQSPANVCAPFDGRAEGAVELAALDENVLSLEVPVVLGVVCPPLVGGEAVLGPALVGGGTVELGVGVGVGVHWTITLSVSVV